MPGSGGQRQRGAVRHVVPHAKSLLSRSPVLPGWQTMPSWAEVRRDHVMDGHEALGLLCRLEPAHPPFALAGRPVAVLGPVG